MNPLFMLAASFLLLVIAGVATWHVGREAEKWEREARQWRNVAATKASRIADLEAQLRARVDFQIFFEPNCGEEGTSET